MARIRAVLVGIDVYEQADVPPLGGCVNDVALVRALLKNGFGVPNEDIRVVVDARATKANILHRLTVQVTTAEPGDVVVFYFSGHGSQIRDRDGDELTDHLDEVICPYDMDWDRGTYILDDDVDEVLTRLPPEVVFEAFFDCCFWGAGPRGDPTPHALRADVRYLPPPFDIASRAEGEEDGLGYHYFARSNTFAGQNVLWGASQEGQPAFEDTFDGHVHGIFTYWGCRSIRENIERENLLHYSRDQLLADVRSRLSALGYPQVPELSAPGQLRDEGPLAPEPGWPPWIRGRWAGPDQARGPRA